MKYLAGYTPTVSQISHSDDVELYKDLVIRVGFVHFRETEGSFLNLMDFKSDIYPWSRRHTWKSWHDRYLSNKLTFDGHIHK